ncbi:hypothetical protein Tco_1107011 [Tanacetum coccineum]
MQSTKSFRSEGSRYAIHRFNNVWTAPFRFKFSRVKIEEPKENIKKRSGRRLKMKAPKRSKRQKIDSDHEEESQLRTFLKIVPEEDEKIDYEVLGTRMDLVEIHSLIMKRFETIPPEGIDLLLWVLRLDDGTEINMLAKRRYPLTKNTLERMIDLKLTAVSNDDTIFDWLRFIEQQIDEFGGQDGNEEDL